MKRQRGISTFGAVLLAGTAGLLTATLMMDWMVVDVHVVVLVVERLADPAGEE